MTQAQDDAVSMGAWTEPLTDAAPWGDEPLEPAGWGDESLAAPATQEDADRIGEALVAKAEELRLAASTPAEVVALEGSIERHPAGSQLATRSSLPAVLAGTVGQAVRDWTNPDEVGPFAGSLRAGIVDYVQGRHVELVAQRPEGKRLTTAAAQPELVFLAQSSATLDAIGDAVKAGAKEARDLAGEVLVDLTGERALKGGTVSERVSDQHGGIKVTRTQPTETVVQQEHVLDVLVAHLLDLREHDEEAGAREQAWQGYYARGVREGVAALLELVSPLKWKTTAIDALVQELERRELEPLAIRLDHAQGKKPKGNPSTKVERTPAKAAKA